MDKSKEDINPNRVQSKNRVNNNDKEYGDFRSP